MRKRLFPPASLSPSWACFGLTTFQVLSTLFSILALRTAMKKELIEFRTVLQMAGIINHLHNFSLNN